MTLPIANYGSVLVVWLATACVFLTVLSGCISRDVEANDKLTALKRRLEFPKSGGVMVVAHRSCWRDSAENSLTAVATCIQQGVDMVEIDVHRTGDGYLVSIHDDTVDRTTNGSGPVAEMTLAEIRALRLKKGEGGPQAPLTGWQVPLLEEMLLAAKGKILINLDVKEAVYDEALALVEMLGMTDQVLIKMVALPGEESLQTAAFLGKTYFMPIIRQCRPEKVGMICSKDLSDVLPGYQQFSPVAYEIVFHQEDYLLDGIGEVKKQNRRLWVNTLQRHHAAGHMDHKAIANPDAHWGHLIDLGADMIQTDNPFELVDYLKARGLR